VADLPVDERDYQVPFKLTAKLNKLTISLDRPRLDENRLREVAARQTDYRNSSGEGRDGAKARD